MKTHYWLIALLLIGCEKAGVPSPQAMNQPREEPATPAEQPTLRPAPLPEPTPPANPPQMNPPQPEPSTPPPDPVLTPEQQVVFDAVKKEQIDRMEDAVGQFASGRSPTYRGTFTATDNKGTIQGQTNGVFPNGGVIAALEARQDLWTGQGQIPGLRLFLVSETSPKQFFFSQHETEPGVTYFSIVQDLGTSGGVTAKCSGCIASFDATKTTLTVTGSATGMWGTGSAMTVTTSGSLSKSSPDELNFEDLLALGWSPYSRHEYLSKFVPLAGSSERARQVSGKNVAVTGVPSGTTYHHCDLVTPYQIEVYVNDDDLTKFGVRNFSTQTAQTCCYKLAFPACELPTCF